MSEQELFDPSEQDVNEIVNENEKDVINSDTQIEQEEKLDEENPPPAPQGENFVNELDTMMADGYQTEAIEEHLVWRQNCANMYTSIREFRLEYESLAIEWVQRPWLEMVIGTYIDQPEQEDYVFIFDLSKKGKRPQPISRFAQKGGEVNRIECIQMLGKLFIATFNPEGVISVFNAEDGEVYQLHGHTDNGYGLSWWRQSEDRAYLLSGAEDHHVIVWEFDFKDFSGHKIASLELATPVHDAQWAPLTPGECAVACGDGHVRILQLEDRTIEEKKKIYIHEAEVLTAQYSPFAKDMIAACGGKLIGLFDLRDPSKVLHVLSGHEEDVTAVKWNPHIDGVLASGSQDRRVILWDIRKIGEEQSQEDLEDGAPEILFLHSGHMGPVTSIDWHPTEKWMIASVSEDKICQYWVPNDYITSTPNIPPMPKSLM